MGKQVTYSVSYPLILTRACASRCGYCRYPIIEPGRLPPPRIIRRHLREAVRHGAIQVELVAGEGIDTASDVVEAVRYYGFASYLDYVSHVLQTIEATNRRSHLFSLLNIGPLSLAELKLLRPYLCAIKIMLESADPLLEFREAHREAPTKLPGPRLEAILQCGRAGIPLTTGIMVGIGESHASYLNACKIVAQAHDRYGHIQAFRIQMFHPAEGTLLGDRPEPSDDEFLEVVALAARHLGSRMAIQVSADEHPHLTGPLLQAGVTDFGDISVRRAAKADPSLEALQGILAVETQAQGHTLARRFPVYDPYCSETWYPGGFPHRIPRARSVMAEQTAIIGA